MFAGLTVLPRNKDGYEYIMVKIEKLGVFLSSINAFFVQIDGSEVDIDTPYLSHNRSAIGYDYSGIIKCCCKYNYQ